MSPSILLAVAFAAGFPDAGSPPPSPATPQLTCDIGTRNWCFIRIGAAISMKDAGADRIWTVEQKDEVDDGPLVIVENKACSEKSATSLRLLGTSTQTYDGRPYVSTKYQVTSQGCVLEFRWPQQSKHQGVYREVMRYGVFVGDIEVNPERLTQLYKVDAVE